MLSGVGPAPHRKQRTAVPARSLITRSMFDDRRGANVRCSMLLEHMRLLWAFIAYLCSLALFFFLCCVFCVDLLMLSCRCLFLSFCVRWLFCSVLFVDYMAHYRLWSCMCSLFLIVACIHSHWYCMSSRCSRWVFFCLLDWSPQYSSTHGSVGDILIMARRPMFGYKSVRDCQPSLIQEGHSPYQILENVEET